MTQRDDFETRLKYLQKTAGKRPKLAPIGAEGKDGYPAPKRSRIRRILTPVLNIVLAVALIGAAGVGFEDQIHRQLPEDVTLSAMFGLDRASIAAFANSVGDAFWTQDMSAYQIDSGQGPGGDPAPDNIEN